MSNYVSNCEFRIYHQFTYKTIINVRNLTLWRRRDFFSHISQHIPTILVIKISRISTFHSRRKVSLTSGKQDKNALVPQNYS